MDKESELLIRTWLSLPLNSIASPYLPFPLAVLALTIFPLFPFLDSSLTVSPETLSKDIYKANLSKGNSVLPSIGKAKLQTIKRIQNFFILNLLHVVVNL